LRIVTQMAVVDGQKCTACKTCIQVCPVVAIRLGKAKGKTRAVSDKKACQACGICITRCPEKAIALEARTSPVKIGTDATGVSAARVAAVCRRAHMYPEQIVCYCHRVQAKEIAAAILSGAKTPEQVARMTGARTGCGVLCITGVIRLLQSAGLELKRAPGCQWYGNAVTIWDLPDDVMKKFDKAYYMFADREKINEHFPGGERE
jgi:Pyruvate/2-oxoacid:ferredoxin oxidoreductase delta subunit/bacterioferritin-associated ferredoxin